jgi:dTDP-glucose 4,6-dehydratase
MNMKLLIFGSKGWIGEQVINILKEKKISFIEAKVRADSEADVLDELSLHQPTNVLSLIGRTHGVVGDKEFTTIDYLEQDGKLVENVRDNLYAPFNIAFHCHRMKIHYTYLGTGCIFHSDYGIDCEGNEIVNAFSESSQPNFFGSSYSIVKGFTDRMMHLFDNVLNVRIRMPITDLMDKRNFITKIASYERIASVSNAMTVLPELLPVMIDLMQKNETGTVNLVNPGAISHNEILTMYREIVNPAFVWKNFSIEEQNKILASKRSNNHLDTSRLEKMYPHVKHIKDSVRDILVRYAENLKNTRKVLITGGCGFIGSHFLNKYYDEHPLDTIINIDAMYYCARKDNVRLDIRRSTRYIFYNYNLNDRREPNKLGEILRKHSVDRVFHFAAQSHVQNSFSDSLQFTYDNILGTHILIEELRKYILDGNSVDKIVHVSTDEVYGDSNILKNEESAFCPTNPYAATKASSELISKAYYYSFNLPIIITRGNNVFGPNQYPEKVIPKFIKQLRQGKKVTIQGDGSCVRDFLYVDDVVNAFLKINENGRVGEIYNIGCDENMGVSVRNVAEMLIQKIKKSTDYEKYIEYVEDRPYNDFRYTISNDKVKKLGWSIVVSFEDGIDLLLNMPQD